MVKKEFYATRGPGSSNARNRKAKPAIEAQNSIERSYSDMDGELLTDSAANKTYLTENDLPAGNCKAKLTVQTANGVTKVTRINKIQLKVADGTTLNTTAYTLPKTSKNILCREDIVAVVGEYVFTKHEAYAAHEYNIRDITTPINQLGTHAKRIFTMNAKFKNCNTVTHSMEERPMELTQSNIKRIPRLRAKKPSAATNKQS